MTAAITSSTPPTRPAPDSPSTAVLQAVEQGLARAEDARREGDIAGAITHADAALAVALGARDLAAEALCRLELGNLHRYIPNAVESIRQLSAAEQYFRSTNDPRLVRALVRQGMTLGDMGDHTQALDLYREALGLIDSAARHEQPFDPKEEATCRAAIGVACTQLDDFEQAEEAYRRSIPLFELAGSHESVVFVLNNLAILRVRTVEKLEGEQASTALVSKQAHAFVEEGLARNEQVGSKLARAALFNTRADLLSATGQLEESLTDVLESLTTYRSIPLPRGEADALTNLGEVLLKLGRTAEAITHFESAERIVHEHDLRDHERKLEQLFASAYEKAGNAARALEHFKCYHQLEVDNQRRDTQKKLQQLAMREEISRAMAEARAQRERSDQLARENQTLDRIAHEDALTGVANRRRLEEWAHDQPTALPEGMAVALLDIDHFKRINDTYSHATGDAVLREMGAVLRSQARSGDLVARYGGEEFVVVMNGVDRANVADLMERLRSAVQSHAWAAVDPSLAVTTSIGVACASGADAFQSLLQAADAALYAAKNSGRNRVVIAG